MIKELTIHFNNEKFNLTSEEYFYEGELKGLKYRIKDEERDNTFLVWKNEQGNWISNNETLDFIFLKKVGENILNL